MLVSVWGLLCISALIIVPITFALARYFGKPSKISIGIVALGLALFLAAYLGHILPNLTIVYYGEDGYLEHKERAILFSHKNHKYSMFSFYVDNQTDQTFVVYPVCYGDVDDSEIKNKLLGGQKSSRSDWMVPRSFISL